MALRGCVQSPRQLIDRLHAQISSERLARLLRDRLSNPICEKCHRTHRGHSNYERREQHDHLARAPVARQQAPRETPWNLVQRIAP
jgi:hypothetical protein